MAKNVRYSSWGAVKTLGSDIKNRCQAFEKRASGWLNSWAAMVGDHKGKRAAISVRVGMGLPTCINGISRRISVGYTEDELKLSYPVWEKLMWTSTGHELGHDRYTSTSISSDFIDRVAKDFIAEFPHIPDSQVKKGIATKMAAMLHNIVEDGRIETRFSDDFTAFGDMFKSANLRCWKREDEIPEEDFNKWARMAIYLSVLGVPPKWARKLDPTDPLMALVKPMADILDESCLVKSHQEACDGLFWDFYQLSKDYLKEALKEAMENSPKKQELIDQLMNMLEEFTSTSASEDGSSGSGSGSGSGSDSGSDSDSGSSSKKSSSGDGSDDGKDDKKSERSKSRIGHGGQVEKTSTGKGDNVKSAGGGEAGAERGSDEELAIDWDALEAEAEAAEAEDESYVASGKPDTSKPTIEEELASIYEEMGDNDAVGFEEIPRGKSWSAKPYTDQSEINRLRKAVSRIQAEKAARSQSESGLINAKKLARYASGNYKIFTQKQKPDSGIAVAVAWDGSGSMSGTKQVNSTKACTILEKAFQNIPMKIVNFSVARKCEHYLVKDFDEKARGNLSFAYGYGTWRGFNGGNKDGYSIRVLTKNLLSRPEKRKILFVLSDGLPSDYSGGYKMGAKDVHEAVKLAVKQGVTVIAIAFGDGYTRWEDSDFYKFMYVESGGRLIECNSSEICDNLCREMKKIATA